MIGLEIKCLRLSMALCVHFTFQNKFSTIKWDWKSAHAFLTMKALLSVCVSELLPGVCVRIFELKHGWRGSHHARSIFPHDPWWRNGKSDLCITIKSVSQRLYETKGNRGNLWTDIYDTFRVRFFFLSWKFHNRLTYTSAIEGKLNFPLSPTRTYASGKTFSFFPSASSPPDR